jgi:PIN domain nuclease of toxin-antitoxin system
MPILNLDTHILIHGFQGGLLLNERILLSNHSWGISAIVLWELTKLIQLGRVELDLDDPDVKSALNSVHVWPLDLFVARTSTMLDFHSDPADEIIAATSIVYNVPLLTRDKRILCSKMIRFAQTQPDSNI